MTAFDREDDLLGRAIRFVVEENSPIDPSISALPPKFACSFSRPSAGKVECRWRSFGARLDSTD
jgi:hypothetical protein